MKPDGADTSPCAIATSVLFDERRMYACGVGVMVAEDRDMAASEDGFLQSNEY